MDRNLTTNTIVICDSLNYIKGFRYQLFCTARTTGTPSCVVYCDFDADTVREWNAKRGTNPEDAPEAAEAKWNPKLLDELIMRFEVPSESRRYNFRLMFFPLKSLCITN